MFLIFTLDVTIEKFKDNYQRRSLPHPAATMCVFATANMDLLLQSCTFPQNYNFAPAKTGSCFSRSNPNCLPSLTKTFFFPFFFLLLMNPYFKVQYALSLSLSLSLSVRPPPPPPHLPTFLCHSSVPFQFYVTQYSLHHTDYTSLSCQQSSKHRTSCKN